MAERQLPDFGPDNSANQPLQFDFPKCEFGKTKIVKRAFQAQWFGKWRWLYYDCSRDLAFCHTCVTAFKTSKLKLSSSNVKSHEKSTTHKRAVESVITLPQTTRDVSELLSSAHTAEKRKSRQCLITIAENICYCLSVCHVPCKVLVCTNFGVQFSNY